jgi:hypothetical protein
MAARELTFGLAAGGLAVGLLMLSAICPGVAEARGFVSFHFGVPLFVGPPVYYPPPVYYYPPPVYIYQPPVYISQSTQAPQACHEYQTTAIIGGTPQPVYGRVCLQPDGTWRIVQ